MTDKQIDRQTITFLWWKCNERKTHLSWHRVSHGFFRGKEATRQVRLVGERGWPRGKLPQVRCAGDIGEIWEAWLVGISWATWNICNNISAGGENALCQILYFVWLKNWAFDCEMLTETLSCSYKCFLPLTAKTPTLARIIRRAAAATLWHRLVGRGGRA